MLWDLSAPPPTSLTDRAVALEGADLQGRRIALMVTGGIAAMRAPMLARALRRQGADVVAFASTQALRYVGEDALAWATTHDVVTHLSAQAEHLSDASPFDAYLVAPASYNTINKMALGIADTPLLSTLASALGRLEHGRSEVLVAPTMHGSMHNRILTDNMRQLRHLGVTLVPPMQSDGKNKLPNDATLGAWTARALAQGTLRGRAFVVQGPAGAVPSADWGVHLDVARVELAHALAHALWVRGATVYLAQGDGVPPPPEHLVPTLTPPPYHTLELGWSAGASLDLRALANEDDLEGSRARALPAIEALPVP